MNRIFVFIFLLMVFFSCEEKREKNYPIIYHTKDNFMESSKKNNKEILKIETEIIKKYIKKRDTLSYNYMGDGYWMATIESEYKSLKADSNDEVHYIYETFSLNDQMIYSEKENGQKIDKLDKTNIFKGLYYALQNIEEGSRVSLIFPSPLAYGFFGDEKKIKPLTPIVLNLKINKIVKHHE